MKKQIENLSRRQFVKNTTGLASKGLVLGIFAGATSYSVVTSSLTENTSSFTPNVFLSIDTTGLITIVCARSEMGQGVRTSMPAIIADELNARWDQISIIQAEGDVKYGDQNTDGSTSVRIQFPLMRQAGATAREMLINAAASVWGVPSSECKADNHVIHHAATQQSLGYGALAQIAGTQKIPQSPKLKSPKDFIYIGKSLSNIDNPDFITGKAQFGIDTHIDGMMYASIERSPVLGGSIASYDASAALAIPGVKKVIALQAAPTPPKFNSVGGLAVIADNTWTAAIARKALKIKWNKSKNQNYNSANYRLAMEKSVTQPCKVAYQKGNVDAAMTKAERIISANYYVPHLSHAPMEPPCCLALVNNSSCEVWAPTQDPQVARKTIADVLGFDQKKVKVNVTLLGGAFGRKSKPDFIVEAVLLSKEMGVPIKLTWSREDDIRHDYYHSSSAQHLAVGLDNKANVIAWLHRAAFPSINTTFAAGKQYASPWEMSGATQLPYNIDHIRCENAPADAPIRIGWLRSVHNINQAFAINSFMAEIATATGKNQKDYLLELLNSPAKNKNHQEKNDAYAFDITRMRQVVKVVAEKANWSNKNTQRRALGIAAHYSFYSYVAQVADVSVDNAGNVKVHTIHCAIDCGTVINPDRVTSQIEGAIIYGLSNTLYGAITADNGRIQQSNFHDYPVLRLNETPDISVHIIDSYAPPSGVGEPGTPPVSGAVVNAIFNATGIRLRELPIRQEALKA